ncbi:hypothetical protein COT49_01015 [candidate division WWE3 bacterium CG08_land_8_20_14_0_20_40_13]|uniref:Glycosyltransferase RgtA/B/C/D-like domain-containing protein n=1 Tax=candidate division WWE3 bacterium CG08_land_8_20_14_0_20_40_13 TaxID=1975084 RepID=A0A2H0XGJ1_UNCKA|nr:MAG: hypothetical protein COT49_01015 [candidate division WWE3 bacterium CG08_land_8_20_14_0_20_40_13]
MIINYLKDNIIGGIGDQVGGFIRLSNQKLVGAPFNNGSQALWEGNQPIFSFIYNRGSQIVDPVLFSNLFSLVSVLLLFVFSFLLFRLLKINNFVGIVLSLILTFSPYTYLHLGVHPALMQAWMVPAFVLLLVDTCHGLEFRVKSLEFSSKFKIIRRMILTGAFLSLVVLTSNYLGYFLMLLSGVFAVANIVVKLVFKEFSWGWLKSTVMRYAVIFGTCLLISIPALLPYFKSSYGGPSVGSIGVSRSLEDFQNFSGRPWYLFLPPIQNPVFGTITKSVLEWMKNGWGYYLADDYFNSESPEMFLGISNLVVFSIAVGRAFKKFKFQMTNVKLMSNGANDETKTILIFVMTGFLLFLFTLPPFFDFAGVKVYTPGFILYKLFPMFRVTQRLGVVILMCVLVLNGIFISEVLKKVQSLELIVKNLVKSSELKYKNILVLLLIFGYAGFSLVEFFVPIRIMNIKNVPPVYEYLSKIDDPAVIIATYPNQSPEDIFWVSRHKKGLINPRDYVNIKFQFNSKEFTKDLSTIEGLLKAKKYNVSYIVFDRMGFSDHQKSANSEKFFGNNLTLEKDFEGVLLFKF